MSFRTTKKHHKHINNPFPSKPNTLPFLQGNLYFKSQILFLEKVFDIGHDFQLNWSPKNGGSISVFHKSNLSRSMWSTISGRGFISAAVADTEVEESRGSFAIKDREIHLVCNHQTIENIKVIEESDVTSLENDQDLPSFQHEMEQERARCSVLLITGRIFNVKERGKRIHSTVAQENGEFVEKKPSVYAKYWMLFNQKTSNQVGFQVRLGKPNVGNPEKVSPRTYSYRNLTRKIGRMRRSRVGWSEFFTRKRLVISLSPAEEENVVMNNEGCIDFNRICITYSSEKNERFYGFGEQFSHMDFKGKKVPIFVQEQGIGRGDQPITFAANLVSYRSGGDESTTYAPSPFYMTSKMRSLYLEGYSYSVFDLTKHDSVQIQVHGDLVEGRLLNGNSPAELIENFTETIGRPQELPEWIISGAVVGMQGGTDAVRHIWKELQTHDTPVSAFWLQDWVGQRKTVIGSQLWWNWEVDTNRYSGWQKLISDLSDQQIKVMTYCNPCLAPMDDKPNVRRNLFEEAMKLDILVKNEKGGPYMVPNTAFDVGMLDLTHPKTASWFKQILQEMVDDGVRGWMADFGEGLPVDACLYSGANIIATSSKSWAGYLHTCGFNCSDAMTILHKNFVKTYNRPIGEDPITAHNRYPEIWAQINREFVEDWRSTNAGEENEVPDDHLVFFMRAGFRDSPKWASLFWEGDQMVSWQANDGIKSAVVGLLSSGLSGYAFNHSDIGGYCSVNLPFFKYHRSEELLLRWMELNAFTTVFRTHEGNRPSCNTQFYSNQRTLSHFSRFAKIYEAWKFYRIQLVKEASEKGLPICRHLFLHYPEDEYVNKLTYEQFLVGTEILVAPVLDKGKEAVKVYFPEGERCSWKHVWTGQLYSKRGLEVYVEARIGYPAVFVKEGSQIGDTFLKNLKEHHIL